VDRLVKGRDHELEQQLRKNPYQVSLKSRIDTRDDLLSPEKLKIYNNNSTIWIAAVTEPGILNGGLWLESGGEAPSAGRFLQFFNKSNAFLFIFG